MEEHSMPQKITNSDDVIDSRDINERIEDLELDLESCQDDEGFILESLCATEDQKELYAEWKVLKELANEGAIECDSWDDGEALIRYSYFTAYAQELVTDIGDLPKDIPHYLEIDWNATARNIKQDYSELSFDGVTYYIRSC
jgi:hypothetical protein